VLEAMHQNTLPFINSGQSRSVPVPGIGFSLTFIVVVLTVTTIASLRASRGIGAVPGTSDVDAD
jgi:tellurite resistance protein TerC